MSSSPKKKKRKKKKKKQSKPCINNINGIGSAAFTTGMVSGECECECEVSDTANANADASLVAGAAFDEISMRYAGAGAGVVGRES